MGWKERVVERVVESSDFHLDDVIKFDLYQCAAAPMTELNIRYITSPQIGEKTQGKTSHSFSDKTAPSQHQHSTLCLPSFLSFS